MAIVYYDRDADPRALRGKTIAVIGYGSQGHAHAQNLRDSGHEVIVGLQAGSKSWAKAEQDGFTVRETADAARNADVVALLVPDQNHREAYAKVAPFMGKGRTLLVAHAFSVHFGEVTPHAEADVVMIAPKAPGHRMREVFKEGKGVPALLAVHQDVSGKAEQTALAYAQGVGATRAGVIKTTFAEEVETDWFGEQVILCGGISELMKASFDTLVDAGYQPEVAYFECVNEMKLIVDLIYEGGLSYMRYSVSDTAEYGDYVVGPRIINAGVREEMKRVLSEIRDGTHAKKWIAEYRSGAKNLYAQRAKEQEQPLEQVGRRLREMMPWLPKREIPTRSARRPSRRQPPEPVAADADQEEDDMRQIEIFDTTLRDGEQAPGAALTAAAKLEVARALAELGVDVIEAGFPAASDGEAAAVRQIAQEVTGVTMAALARANDGDVDIAAKALAPAQRKRIHVFIGTSRHPSRAQAAHHAARVPAARRARGPPRDGARRRDRVLRRGRDADGHPLPRHRLPGRGRRGRADHEHPRHRRLRAAGRVRSHRARDPRRAHRVQRRHPRVGPLPQRSRARGREHPRRDRGRRLAGARDDERHRRARRQRVARGDRHGAPLPLRLVQRGHARAHRAHRSDQPSRVGADRDPGAAEQGRRRGERVRARLWHPPGRRHQGPADLRDHDPASRSAGSRDGSSCRSSPVAPVSPRASRSSGSRSTARSSTTRTASRCAERTRCTSSTSAI